MFNYSTLIAVACHGIKKGLYMSSYFLPTFTAYFTLKVRYFSLYKVLLCFKASELLFFSSVVNETPPNFHA